MADGRRSFLTPAEALDALSRLGAPEPRPDGHARCPMCADTAGLRDLFTLQVSENGTGSAAYICRNGCSAEAIDAALRTALRIIPEPVEETTALGVVQAALTELDPENLRDLERIVRYGEQGDLIEMHFADGRRLDLGSSEQLQRQDHFLRRVARLRSYPDPFKGKDYRQLMRGLQRAAEQRAGPGSAGEEAEDWIETYVRNSQHTRGVDLGTTNGKLDAIATAQNGYPFSDTGGRLHLPASAMVRWLKRQDIALVTTRELTTRLASLGYEGRQLQARESAEQIKKARVWAAPNGGPT